MPTPVTITINGKVDQGVVDSFKQATGLLQTLQREMRRANQISGLFGSSAQNDLAGTVRGIVLVSAALATMQRGLAAAQASFKSYSGATFREMSQAGMLGEAAGSWGKQKLGPMLIGGARFTGWAGAAYLTMRSVQEWVEGSTAQRDAARIGVDLAEGNAALAKRLEDAVVRAAEVGRLNEAEADALLARIDDAFKYTAQQTAEELHNVRRDANLPTQEQFLKAVSDLSLKIDYASRGYGPEVPTLPSASKSGVLESSSAGYFFEEDQLKQAYRLRIELNRELDAAQANSFLTEEDYHQTRLKNMDAMAALTKRQIQLQNEAAAALVEQQKQAAQNRQLLLTGAAQMFGSFASLAQSFGRKGFAAWKALALAEAVVSTAAGVARALGSASPPVNIILAAITGAAGAAQIARIATTQPSGYARGGYTGAGAQDEPAGVVHRGEFVLPADTVAQIGLPALEAMRQGHGAGGRLNVAVFDDRSAVKTWMQSQEGQAVILEIVGKNRHRIV